jgi:ABC-type lipoprotein release transport system permease subunit
LSRRQILAQLSMEYTVVAVLGIVVGVYLGVLVGRRMLSFLDVTATGEQVEPGFILQTDWGFVALGAVAVIVTFALSLLLAVRALGRTSDAQALRTE